MIKLYKSRLVDKKIFGSESRHLVFHLKMEIVEGGELEFIPGQFVNVMLPNKIARAYSIGQVVKLQNGNQQIEFTIDYIPNGIGSEFFKNLNVGDDMLFKAPFGRFNFQEEDFEKDILFIGLATGIVPFVPMVSELISKNFKHKITVLHGVPYEELNYLDVQFEEFVKIASEVGVNLKFERWVSRASENYVGNKGRISLHIDNIEESNFANLSAYICGGTEAILSIKNHLKDRGVGEEGIRFERFY